MSNWTNESDEAFSYQAMIFNDENFLILHTQDMIRLASRVDRIKVLFKSSFVYSSQIFA